MLQYLISIFSLLYLPAVGTIERIVKVLISDMMREALVPLYINLVFMAMAIPENSVTEYTGDSDCSLTLPVHLLVLESVDSGSPLWQMM